MFKKCCVTVVVLAALAGLQGCVALVAAGVVGGVIYTTSDDSSEISFEQPWGTVFEACVEELAARGNVGVEDRDNGFIQGFVDGAKVKIQLDRPTDNSVRVTVSARKNEGISPAPDVAETLAFALAKRLSPETAR